MVHSPFMLWRGPFSHTAYYVPWPDVCVSAAGRKMRASALCANTKKMKIVFRRNKLPPFFRIKYIKYADIPIKNEYISELLQTFQKCDMMIAANQRGT